MQEQMLLEVRPCCACFSNHSKVAERIEQAHVPSPLLDWNSESYQYVNFYATYTARYWHLYGNSQVLTWAWRVWLSLGKHQAETFWQRSARAARGWARRLYKHFVLPFFACCCCLSCGFGLVIVLHTAKQSKSEKSSEWKKTTLLRATPSWHHTFLICGGFFASTSPSKCPSGVSTGTNSGILSGTYSCTLSGTFPAFLLANVLAFFLENLAFYAAYFRTFFGNLFCHSFLHMFAYILAVYLSNFTSQGNKGLKSWLKGNTWGRGNKGWWDQGPLVNFVFVKRCRN